MNHSNIVQRWAREARKDKPKFVGVGTSYALRVDTETRQLETIGSKSPNSNSWRNSQLRRQGVDLKDVMPLARMVGDFAIINGDQGTFEQNQHQIKAREGIQKELPENAAVIPYSALDGAGITFNSISIVDVTPDRENVEVKYESRDINRVPPNLLKGATSSGWGVNQTWDLKDVRPDFDGFYRGSERRHMLGEALFNASYEREIDGETIADSGQFFSAFDYQERTPLYFLCEMPQEVGTIAEAFEALKPDAVKKSEQLGETVVRQGDLFAIETAFDTNELYSMGAAFHTIAGRARTLNFPNPYLLDTAINMVKSFDYQHALDSDGLISELQLKGTNHIATLVATLDDGRQFVQGYMLHRPEGRAADHADRYISDTWFETHRNTVPFTTGAAHAWNAVGMVD